ncbi:MAG: ribosome maturation factor RimP [Rhodothermaceae bacterium]|nr:ribosome maturation factor RimP [Rhodothermaceae bacterium]
MPQLPTDNLDLVARVRALAEDAVDGTDLYVVDVEVRGRQGGRVVDVFVDADDGAGIDAIKEASRSLSFLLDTEDLIKGQYRLNVSSPGADRPLALPRQYPKHVGRDVEVTYAVGEELVTVTGTLARADETTIAVAVAGQDAPTGITYDTIREARVLLPW